jgi:hypothetical protein
VSVPSVTQAPAQHFWNATAPPSQIMLGRVHLFEVPHLHAPPTQASASSGLQTLPHDPQFAMSSDVSMHASLQHDVPAGQLPPVSPQTQLPATQASVSTGSQALPHAPQLVRSVATVRQPSGQQS